MSVTSLSNELGNLIADYNAKMAVIQKNEDISDSNKARQMNQLYADTLPRAESLTARLLGDIVEQSDGRNTLSDAGAVWASIIAAVQAQAAGADKFLGARYKNPELLPILAARINSKRRASMNGHEFLRAYEAMSADEKNYCQDMGADLFAGLDGHDWRKAQAHIANDLKAAENAVFEPLQNAVNDAIDTAYKVAFPAYRAAANAFGRESFFIQEVANGFIAERVGLGYRVDRKSWGLRTVNRDQITHHEAPSDAFPKARRIGQ